MTITELLTPTRLTPDDLLPAVGEEYRHRRTGQIVMVLRQNPHVHCVKLSNGIGLDWWITEEQLWDLYIHAKVGL